MAAQVWGNVKFDLSRGERVGILGPNGSGKTTLLRVLTGGLDADGGEIRWGANTTIGYYDQRLDDFDPDATVFDEVLNDVEGYNDKQIRDALGAMLFSGDDVEKPMRLLSGGERARVAMTKLLMQRPNVLLLDEPTNHLDINACEALEQALRSFEGSLLIVSHDREFLQKSSSRLLVIEPPNVIDFAGTYDQWTAKQRLASNAAKPDVKRPPAKPPAASPAVAKPQVTNAKKKDNPYARPFGRMSVGEIESKLKATERELNQAQQRAADPQLFRNPGKAKAAADDVARLTKQQAELEEEYLMRDAG